MADYRTMTDVPECPNCGEGCGGHDPVIYHVDCGEPVAECDCQTPAAVKLQAWLDSGTDAAPSKAVVRAVLWDLAEAQAQVQRFGTVDTEWTVARHGRHSIEYGDARNESYVRNEVREERACGEVASVAFRTVGQWRHEDPEAQQHADAVNALLKRSASQRT